MRLYLIALLLLLAWMDIPQTRSDDGRFDKRIADQEAQKRDSNKAKALPEGVLSAGGSNIENPDPNNKKREPYDARDDSLYRWYMRATIAGVLVALGGIWILFCQTRAIDSQIKTMMNSERAHVDASFSPWGDQGLHKVMLTNHGKSVANINSYSFVHASYPPDATDFSEDLAVRRFSDGMALNQILAPSPQPKELLEIDINHYLTEEDKTGKNIATFSVLVAYTDIFGDPHETEMVYSYSRLRKALRNEPRYNRYT